MIWHGFTTVHFVRVEQKSLGQAVILVHVRRGDFLACPTFFHKAEQG